MLAPTLTATPAIDQAGRLRIVGFFPTRPLQINFDLLFQPINKEWRLFGISIATPEAPPAQPQAQAPAAPPKQSAPAPKR